MIEYSTPAVYHCTDKALDELDKVQRRFLRAAELTAKDALLLHNLAPLQTRRDIALLGLIHRTVLGKGPPQFQKWFYNEVDKANKPNTLRNAKRHDKQLADLLGFGHAELLRRSFLSLVRVYNSLPQEAVNCKTVSKFQRWLQGVVKRKAEHDEESWETCLNKRRQWVERPRSRSF